MAAMILSSGSGEANTGLGRTHSCPEARPILECASSEPMLAQGYTRCWTTRSGSKIVLGTSVLQVDWSQGTTAFVLFAQKTLTRP
ncbi:hypothetical protein CBOM_05692 [Ceraceosorus bombacis]|uniref:Uncharacterized protein n=1 Tax=Ceraceosorus bombacis TaxID=401625 RepID=A0A0P1BS53_9BASI|nr:hypothetical protein CBOM_05692 [Ceraceosorus bombacis]